MSLEVAIRENTDAIYAFIAEIKRSNLRTPEVTTPLGNYETKAIPPCSGHAAQQEVDIATADALDPPATPQVSVDTLRIALKDVLTTHGRETVEGLLSKYGASKLPEVPVAQHVALYEDIKGLG